MKTHQFFEKFANTPIDKRYVVLNRMKYGELTLNGLHFQIQQIQDKLRPLLIEQNELLEIAEEFLRLRNKKLKCECDCHKETKICKSGHIMAGIGGDSCPECEAPYK